ncbi:nuclease-related domain-containing protein [Guptibacillus algicola]|uniref:nuclease-related domain-containing protein n=1 Tax=Guptibacillus algicola TaxID=225844 RepID=UPI001CD266D6|nr:nuclease-related domain-containing protein [Alkalihalobacillus algicola]MCA0986761.1 NERD domain-containing protein [Alkalihalobacillus algicola]
MNERIDENVIAKNRNTPQYLLKLTALMKRLPSHHPIVEEVRELVAIHKAGFNGERALDFPLSLVKSKDHTVYHDIRISNISSYFQMDSLVVTPSYLLIIEVKNISGTLLFDPIFNQLIRTSKNNDVEEAFPDPLTQVRRQHLQLLTFLKQHRFPSIPIETLVVVSNRRTVLKATNDVKEIATQVIKSDYLPTKIKAFDNKYLEEKLSMKEMRRLGRLLIKHHTPLDIDVLRRFSLSRLDLLEGVHCPECSYLPMKRLHGRWICMKCGGVSREAHLEALRDYALLVSNWVTNQEVRRFLKVESADAVKRLLGELNLEYVGANKARKYKLDNRVINRFADK